MLINCYGFARFEDCNFTASQFFEIIGVGLTANDIAPMVWNRLLWFELLCRIGSFGSIHSEFAPCRQQGKVNIFEGFHFVGKVDGFKKYG